MSFITKAVATVAALGLVAPVALAETSLKAEVNAETERPSAEVRVNATAAIGTSTRGSDESELRDDNASATGTASREENESEVATQVRALLTAADRDGGIGEEVRDIAHDVASSSERSSEAKASVEGRPGWLTFIIGTDYGNLGKLRSEIATTENHIDRLTKAMSRTTDASVKATLQAQINALEVQASTTAEFVKENEDQFSIFGWFFKLFS